MIKRRDEIFEEIARKHGLVTLQLRNSDRLDFYDMSVQTIGSMLKEAYEAGMLRARANEWVDG